MRDLCLSLDPSSLSLLLAVFLPPFFIVGIFLSRCYLEILLLSFFFMPFAFGLIIFQPEAVCSFIDTGRREMSGKSISVTRKSKQRNSVNLSFNGVVFLLLVPLVMLERLTKGNKKVWKKKLGPKELRDCATIMTTPDALVINTKTLEYC